MPPTGNVFTCDAGTRVRGALCFANIEEVFRSFDLRKLIERNQGRQHSLLSEYINPQMAGVLKTERTAHKTYRTRDQAKADVFDYIELFYNPRRRHSTLGYLSPMEFERQAELA